MKPILLIVSLGVSILSSGFTEEKPPEQQTREFFFSVSKERKIEPSLSELIRKSNVLRDQPERAKLVINNAFDQYGAPTSSRFVRSDELGSGVKRVAVVTEIARGPAFWQFVFYRKSKAEAEWSLISVHFTHPITNPFGEPGQL